MASPGLETSLFPELDVKAARSPDENGYVRSVYAPGPYKPIEDPHISHLLQYYMHNIAPWLDLTDPLCHFARRVPHMAIRCPMLHNAIMALASSRMIRIQKHNELGLEPLTPIRYYGICMSYLIPALEVPDVVTDEAIPVTTVILHTYEMFESHLDSQNHLKGTISVFAHQRHWLGRPGIRRSTFWTYIRQEVIVALQTKRPTNIDWESWQGDMYWGEDSDDAWANRMSWLMVKVVNLYFGEYDSKRAAEEAAKCLRYEVDNWRDQAPLTLGPVCTLESDVCDEEPFPVISYSCLWHFIGMQFYHLACMLLGLKCSQSQSAATADDMLFHAHQICGAAITLGKRSPGAMINSIGPLIVCGQVVTKPCERMRLLNLLTEIGAVTGWPVSNETADLLHDWSVAKCM
ncbi:Fc.00g048010.m01.CDS01 [Cosmosporella sp. VM-42]